MTRRELEIEAYSQKLFAEEAEQKAEDLGYALELLLNDRFKLFHTATTSDKSTHEFLMGIARNIPINDIFRSVKASSQTEDRRIILFRGKQSRSVHQVRKQFSKGSAYSAKSHL